MKKGWELFFQIFLFYYKGILAEGWTFVLENGYSYSPEEESSKTLGCMGYLNKTFWFWQQKGDFLKRCDVRTRRNHSYFFIFTYWRWLNRRFIWFMVVFLFKSTEITWDPLSVFLGCHITASQREVPEFRDYLGSFVSLSWLINHSNTKKSPRVPRLTEILCQSFLIAIL